jgi:hypothetical protein
MLGERIGLLLAGVYIGCAQNLAADLGAFAPVLRLNLAKSLGAPS